MKNVNVIEISVMNFNEFLEVIKKALIKCKDTQFFISYELFKRLVQENKSRIIWRENVLNSFQYSDKVETAFIFCLMDHAQMKTVQMHFVSNCLDYVQLTFFASKGIVYQHYLKGMKNILIINTD